MSSALSTSSKQKLSDAGIPIYNPIKLGSATQGNNAVWTSESVQLYLDAINRGDEVESSPFNKRVKDFNMRSPNLPFQYSEAEMEMMEMIMEDKVLFGNNFIELKDPEKGWTKVELRDYQEKLLYDYDKHRWHILKFPRQSGKTTTTIVEIVHFMTTNFDKDCVVAAQSENVVSEIFAKIKSAFSAMPFFMQPGVVKFSDSDGTMVLDNGCRLKIGIASESVFQGYTLDFVFIDEFAYIPESKVTKFWVNLYPALQANPNSRCIIASTPNGRNKFYEMWQDAIKKINTFHTSEIRWTDVPRKQSLEDFKAEVIANIGLEGWLMGFECSFDTQLKSIFHINTQLKLRTIQNEVEKKEEEYWSMDHDSIGHIYNTKFLNKEKFNYNIKDDYFVFGIDIGEGLEEDYSVIKIRKAYFDENETDDKLKVKYKLIGVFHDNTYSVQDFAENFMKMTGEFDSEKIKVVVENNNYGAEFFLTIDNIKLNGNNDFIFDEFVFAEFFRDSKIDYEKGIRWNRSNKKTAVRNYKSLITRDIFDDTHPDSINESMNFGRLKNGSYSAQYGNDDLTMTDVTISYYVSNPTNDNFIEDLKILLKPKFIEEQKIEEEKKKNKFVYSDNKGFVMRKHTEKKKNNLLFLARNKQIASNKYNQKNNKNLD